MSYRLTDPNPVYISLLGTENTADGTLTFYDRGTTTPKTTYADENLSTPNANPVELDSAGRADTEIWLDGEYTVILKDSDANTVWTRVVVPQIAPGLAIPDPTGHDGEVLTTDGTNLLWEMRQQLPDPSGSAGEMVVVNADGTGYITQAQPEPPEIPDPDIVVGADYFRAGVSDDPTKYLVKDGSGSLPASGSTGTTGSVVFTEPFGTIRRVFLQATGAGVTPGGHLPILTVTAKSANGFSVTANVNVLSGSGQSNITSPVTFDWQAIGTVEIT
jgi:hypothetical protein